MGRVEEEGSKHLSEVCMIQHEKESGQVIATMEMLLAVLKKRFILCFFPLCLAI